MNVDREGGQRVGPTLAARQAVSFVWRWVLRAVAGYVGFYVVLLAGGMILAPDLDWSGVGGAGAAMVSYAALLLFVLPALVALGAVQGVTVWIVFRLSRGSRKVSAVAGGICAALLCMVLTVVYAHPTSWDLAASAAYVVGSVLVGLVAARLASRDVTRSAEPAAA